MDSLFCHLSPLKELHNLVKSNLQLTVLDILNDMEVLYDDCDKENLIDSSIFLLGAINADSN
jgi:hypothetical protein